MKKIATLAVFTLFAFGLTSCKKDYTCECTYPSNSNLNSSSEVKTTKKDAQDRCDALDATAKAAPTPGSCKLK